MKSVAWRRRETMIMLAIHAFSWSLYEALVCVIAARLTQNTG